MEEKFFIKAVLKEISNKQLLNLWNEYCEDVGDLGKLIYPFSKIGFENLANAPYFHNENDEFDTGKFARAICGLGCTIGEDKGYIAYIGALKVVWFRATVFDMISDMPYPMEEFCDWLNKQESVKIVYSHYCHTSDMTFFTKDIYYKGESYDTQCLGFLFGKETVDNNFNTFNEKYL